MNAIELWNEFKMKCNIDTDEYEAWAFGASPDKLLDLVVQGKKRATASCNRLYELNIDPLPEIGGYSVLLDSNGDAKCIIQTTSLTYVPFKEVDEVFAKKEGEGDESLAYWRKVHKEFFTNCLNEIDELFTEDMIVVCEEFKVVYKII
ncbi:ASCH domain-containing protein [Anaerorhabdus sp.]|jgi:uncharacterized protein YhfF|uniref:ASCH domain-containing protein n=1 Tax=Anaerorhabdus sp. TaxID=1872524 RepID=UPI002FCB6F6F